MKNPLSTTRPMPPRAKVSKRKVDSETKTPETTDAENAETTDAENDETTDAENAETTDAENNETTDAPVNSKPAALVLQNILERKIAKIENYKKKFKAGDGKFKTKPLHILGWRRYCKKEFSLRTTAFFIVCCKGKYHSAEGLISHIYRKH